MDEWRDSVCNLEEVPEILQIEVESKLKNLKLGKATGPGDFETITLKSLAGVITKPLTRILNLILQTASVQFDGPSLK